MPNFSSALMRIHYSPLVIYEITRNSELTVYCNPLSDFMAAESNTVTTPVFLLMTKKAGATLVPITSYWILPYNNRNNIFNIALPNKECASNIIKTTHTEYFPVKTEGMLNQLTRKGKREFDITSLMLLCSKNSLIMCKILNAYCSNQDFKWTAISSIKHAQYISYSRIIHF